MRKPWWLYGILLVLVVFLIIGAFKLQQYDKGEETYFNFREQPVSSGYGVFNDDESYFRSVLRLVDVYESDSRVMADVVWNDEEEEKEQTIEIGNQNGLNYIFVTKQSSTEFYPVSANMVTNKVSTSDLVSELKPYINTDVIMAFYTKLPNLDKVPGWEAKDYITAVEPYIECNDSFTSVIAGDLSYTNCTPFSHQIYVIQN